MPKFTYTTPDGKVVLQAPEGMTAEQAWGQYQLTKKPSAAKPAETKSAPTPVDVGGAVGGSGGGPLTKAIEDVIGSINKQILRPPKKAIDVTGRMAEAVPGGARRGFAEAASAAGQAEEGMLEGGRKSTVPGPAESAKLAGAPPVPQSRAGRAGDFLGQVAGNPATWGMAAGALPATSERAGMAGLGAVERAMARPPPGWTQLPRVNVSEMPTMQSGVRAGPGETLASAHAGGPEGQIAQRVAAQNAPQVHPEVQANSVAMRTLSWLIEHAGSHALRSVTGIPRTVGRPLIRRGLEELRRKAGEMYEQ